MHIDASPNARRLVLAVLAAVVILASPGVALAATSRLQSVELRLVGAQNGRPVLLVAGRIPASAALPTKVTMAIPPGAKIEWAGEILGGDPAKDPTVSYKVRAGKEFDLVDFTLTTSRMGQVEVLVPDAVSSKDGSSRATISWAAPSDIPTARLLVLLPSGATVTSGTVGGKAAPEGSETWYERNIKNVSKGDRLKLEVAFTGGATSGAPAALAGQAQPGGVTSAPKGGGASPLLVISALGLLLSVTYAAWKRVSSDSTQAEEPDRDEPAE